MDHDARSVTERAVSTKMIESYEQQKLVPVASKLEPSGT